MASARSRRMKPPRDGYPKMLMVSSKTTQRSMYLGRRMRFAGSCGRPLRGEEEKRGEVRDFKYSIYTMECKVFLFQGSMKGRSERQRIMWRAGSDSRDDEVAALLCGAGEGPFLAWRFCMTGLDCGRNFQGYSEYGVRLLKRSWCYLEPFRRHLNYAVAAAELDPLLNSILTYR